MAVPKKRTGHSAQGKRRANWKATKPETTVCSNCGQPVLTHTVCTACGYYKGKPVSLKDKAEEAKVEAPVEEPKKTTRKKSTKAKKSEEATEETAEEVKAEEVVDEKKESEE